MRATPDDLRRLAIGWRLARAALITEADRIDTADLPWSPGVADAVAAFTVAWHDELRGLSVRADATDCALDAAASTYGITDSQIAEHMRRIAGLTEPG